MFTSQGAHTSWRGCNWPVHLAINETSGRNRYRHCGIACRHVHIAWAQSLILVTASHREKVYSGTQKKTKVVGGKSEIPGWVSSQ